jgi:hypothetical protein
MSGVITAWVAIAAVGAGTAISAHNANDQKKAIKNAAADATARNDKALAEAKLAEQTAADQAQAQIDNKRRAIAGGSTTVFTNPLGDQSVAGMAKKKILGG